MKIGQRISVNFIRAKFKLLSAISKKKAAKEAFKLFCTPPTREKKRIPEVFKKAEELRFKFEEYNIVGYRWNKGGKRKVLINHGFESSAVNFLAYVNPLIEKGYEVLMFDAPAHGRSSGKRITAIIYKELIKYVHDLYGPVQSYMGHSLGGFAVCLALAELSHDENCKVVLIAPAIQTTTAIDNFFSFIKLDNKVRSAFEGIIETRSGHPVSWFSINRTMKTIRARVLWLHDEGDQVTPLRDAKKVEAENYPNIQFVITRGLGHSRIYRDTDVVNKVVEFL
jgi:pimeloyl-ACP methyl ester carboxylesterase